MKNISNIDGFKVLLVYVNSMMDNLIPLNISSLSACLRARGVQVRLFDTTFYRTSGKSSDEARVETLQVRPFDLAEYGINYKDSDIFEDFRRTVIDYRPDLIGFSVVESTYPLSEKLVNAIADIKGKSKIIFGGIFAVFAPEEILRHPLVDMVCSAEAEDTIVEVCAAIAGEISFQGIANLIFKEDGRIICGRETVLTDLNQLPYLDFSLFEKERFYKPMGGRVLKMVPVEFARGCPYRCTYCASPALAEKFRESGRWYRQKEIKRVIAEIEYYLRRYNVEYFYFISEAFLNMNEKEFDEFVDAYRSIRVPFWFNTRIETVSPDKLKKLKEINCSRISIGLESGSEFLRRNLLKRNYSNEYFAEKFRMFADCGISVSVNNVIGFPDENRGQIFETIDLNRRIKAESFGAYIFQPYRGTFLRDYCLKKGYIREDYLAGDAHLESGLRMPQISNEEIMGLQRTFVLYVSLPPAYYDEIRIAENFDERGNRKFRELAELYYQKNEKVV